MEGDLSISAARNEELFKILVTSRPLEHQEPLLLVFTNSEVILQAVEPFNAKNDALEAVGLIVEPKWRISRARLLSIDILSIASTDNQTQASDNKLKYRLELFFSPNPDPLYRAAPRTPATQSLSMVTLLLYCPSIPEGGLPLSLLLPKRSAIKFSSNSEELQLDGLGQPRQAKVTIRSWVPEDLILSSRPQERLLVLLNPASGNGSAKDVWDKSKGFLMGAGFEIDKYTSKGVNDVRALIRSMSKSQLESYSFILCCSGDGTIHEVLNGFYDRPDDIHKSHKIKLANIPAGSACCLVLNALRESNLKSNVQAALYLVVRAGLKELTVYKYTLQPGNRIDVDFGSERLRFLGGARFDIYGAYQVLAHKAIYARISIDGHEADTQKREYHSICLINLQEISPGFIFDKPGLSLVLSSSRLLPFVISPYSTGDLPKTISIELRQETLVSIDGERYKATSIQGERIDRSGIFVPW